jgi:aspartyl-tRNA(Asn)/glutamyl-tRNA(Gln) amidotransferase subunit B
MSADDAATLCQRPELADYFEQTLNSLYLLGGAAEGQRKDLARLAGNWIRTEVLGRLDAGASELPDLPVDPERLADLLRLLHEGTISGLAAKSVYAKLAADPAGPGPRGLVEDLRLVQVSDADTLARWCDRVLAEHPDEVTAYRGGKTGLLDFLVGQVMRISAGRADPRRVRQRLLERLGGEH